MAGPVDHHKLPDRVALHHPDTDATIVVRASLQEHYEARGWQPVDPSASDAEDSDVQVLPPAEERTEDAFIYGPDQDDPGDLANPDPADAELDPAEGDTTNPDAQEG